MVRERQTDRDRDRDRDRDKERQTDRQTQRERDEELKVKACDSSLNYKIIVMCLRGKLIET